jgi:hypothetical protein
VDLALYKTVIEEMATANELNTIVRKHRKLEETKEFINFLLEANVPSTNTNEFVPGKSLSEMFALGLMYDQKTHRDYINQYESAIRHIDKKKKGVFFERWVKYVGPVNPLTSQDLDDVFHTSRADNILEDGPARLVFLSLQKKWKVGTPKKNKAPWSIQQAERFVLDLKKKVLQYFRLQKQTSTSNKQWRFSLLIRLVGMSPPAAGTYPAMCLDSNKTYGGQMFGVVKAGLCSREYVLQTRGSLVQHNNPVLPKNPKFEVDILHVRDAKLGTMPVMINSRYCNMKNGNQTFSPNVQQEDQFYAKHKWTTERNFFIIKGSPAILSRSETQTNEWQYRKNGSIFYMSGKFGYRGILWNNGPLSSCRATLRWGPQEKLNFSSFSCITEKQEIEEKRLSKIKRHKKHFLCGILGNENTVSAPEVPQSNSPIPSLSPTAQTDIIKNHLPVRLNPRFVAIISNKINVKDVHAVPKEGPGAWQKSENKQNRNEYNMVLSLNIGHNKRPLHFPVGILFRACGCVDFGSFVDGVMKYSNISEKEDILSKGTDILRQTWLNNFGFDTPKKAKDLISSWFRLVHNGKLPKKYENDRAEYLLAEILCPDISGLINPYPTNIREKINYTILCLSYLTNKLIRHIIGKSSETSPQNAPSGALVLGVDQIVHGSIAFAFQKINKKIHNWLTDNEDRISRVLDYNQIEELLNLSANYAWFKPPGTTIRTNKAAQKSYRVNTVGVVPGSRAYSSAVERRVGARAHERLRIMSSFIPHYCAIRGPSAKKSGLSRYQSIGVISSVAMELTCLQTLQIIVGCIARTIDTTPQHPIPELHRAGLPSSGAEWQASPKPCILLFDGVIIGSTHRPMPVYRFLWAIKTARCATMALHHMGISWAREGNELHVLTTAGRLLRPVIRVSPDKNIPIIPEDSCLLPWLARATKLDKRHQKIPSQHDDFRKASVNLIRKAVREGSIVYMGARSEINETVASNWETVAGDAVGTYGFVDLHPIQTYHETIATLPWLNFMSGRRAATYSKITHTQSAGRTDLVAAYDARTEFWASPLYPHRRVVEVHGSRARCDPYPHQCLGTIAAVSGDGHDMEDGCRVSEYLKFLGQGARVQREVSSSISCLSYSTQQQEKLECSSATGSKNFRHPPTHCLNPPERLTEYIATKQHITRFQGLSPTVREAIIRDATLGTGVFPPPGQYIAHNQTIARFRTIDEDAHKAAQSVGQVLRLQKAKNTFHRLNWPHTCGTNMFNVTFGNRDNRVCVNIHTKQIKLLEYQDKINYQGGKGVINQVLPWGDNMNTASGTPFVGRSPSNLVSRQLTSVLHLQLLSSVDRALTPDHNLKCTSRTAGEYVPFQEIFFDKKDGQNNKSSPLIMEMCARRACNLGRQIVVSTQEVWLAIVHRWEANVGQKRAMEQKGNLMVLAQWKVLFHAACYTAWSITVATDRTFEGAARPPRYSAGLCIRKTLTQLLYSIFRREKKQFHVTRFCDVWNHLFTHYMKAGAAVREWDLCFPSQNKVLGWAWEQMLSTLAIIWTLRIKRWITLVSKNLPQNSPDQIDLLYDDMCEYMFPFKHTQEVQKVLVLSEKGGYDAQKTLLRRCEERAYCGKTGFPLTSSVTVGHAEYDVLPRHSAKNVYKGRARGNISVDSFMPHSKRRWKRGTRIGRLRVNASLARGALKHVGTLMNAQCDPCVFHYCTSCEDFSAREEKGLYAPRIICGICCSDKHLQPVRSTYANSFKTHEYMRSQGISMKYNLKNSKDDVQSNNDYLSSDTDENESDYFSLSD